MAKRQITVDQIIEACAADDCRGFRIACGAEVFGVEPDARKYVCECSGKRAVYGAEELMLRFAQ